MIERVIAAFLTNFSLVMLIAGVLMAALFSWLQRDRPEGSFAEQLLRWQLLLSAGVLGVYAFIMHVFFPATAAEQIGWAVSPFQYEVGIADLPLGVLGLIAFWSNFSFRVAAAIAAVLMLSGDAIGHIRQMIVAHNFAPGNAGPWFWTDVLVPILLIACTLLVWRRRVAETGRSQ